MEAGRLGRRPGFADPPVAIHQQPARDLRQPEVQERVDVELVPEHVTAVGLAVEPAGGDAGIVVCRQARARLEQMGDMQPQQELRPRLPGQADVAHVPQFIPGLLVTLERRRERGVAARALGRIGERLVDATVARGVERDHLLDPDRRAPVDLEVEDLVYVVLELVRGAPDVELILAAIGTRAGRLGDLDPGVTGAGLERDHIGSGQAGTLRIEMPTLELPVAGHAPVEHPRVEPRDHLHLSRPVLRHQLPGDGRQVHPTHAHEPPAREARLAPGVVAEAELAGEQRMANVVGMPVGQQLDVGERDQILALQAQPHRRAVGQVDHVLVVDRVAAEDGRLAVVDTVGIGAGVVDVVRELPLRGAADAQVAVAHRRHRLPEALLRWVEAVVDELELTRRVCLRRHAQRPCI